MKIPKQLIPLSQKGDKFIKDSAIAFASIAAGSSISKRNDEIAWDYFNLKIDRSKFKYLTHIGQFRLPAVIRRISIQRAPINLLISTQSRRPFVFNAVAIDEESLKEKFANQFKYVLKKIEQKIKDQIMVYQIGFRKLQDQEQMIMQQLQQEPENEEQAQQLMMLREKLPEIQTAIERMKEEFEESIILRKKDIEQIVEYLEYEYKDFKEMLAQKGIKKIREMHDFLSLRVEYFTDKLVTGKGYYLVDYKPGAKQLTCEAINSMQVYYPRIPGVKWIDEGPWVAIEDWISFSQAVDNYGTSSALDKDAMDELSYYKDYEPGETVVQPNANVYTGSKGSHNGISRKRIWWKSPRKIYFKYTPNKHKEGRYFMHVINDENVYDAKPKKDKGEIAKQGYIYDIYTAVVLNNKYVVEGRRVENPLRRVDNYSFAQLPVIGRSYASYHEEPYSLIWSTKEIQDLHDIVQYHRELYLAASGVKGTIIDLAQKPKGMSKEEQQYHRRLGALYIETVDKYGVKNKSSFNQWKEFDDTISPSIQYLDNILNSLEESCWRSMGIARQRLGQTVNSDLVGTSEMARDQSSLITEILFFESDQVEARAMRRAINLQAKHFWNKESIIQFTNPDLRTEIIKIPANLLNKADFDLRILNNSEEEQKKHEIRQMAVNERNRGTIPFKHLVEIYNLDSLAEMQNKVKRWSDKAEELQTMAMQNQAQAEDEAKKSLIQLEQEFKAMIEQDKRGLEKFKLELDHAAKNQELMLKEQELKLKEKEIDLRSNNELLKTVSNRDVEMNYLSEQTRNNKVQEQIQLIQLMLNKLQTEMESALATQSNQLKDKEIKDKKQLETTKNRDKNRIKN